MVAEAAYYRAEQRGFQGGDPALDWFEAEAEIDRTFLQAPARDEEPGADERAVLEHQLETQLGEWDAQIDELLVQAQHATGALQREYGSHLEALAKKRLGAMKKLEQLHRHTDGVWAELRESLAKVWSELRRTFDPVGSHYGVKE
jgi:hypothetical protein